MWRDGGSGERRIADRAGRRADGEGVFGPRIHGIPPLLQSRCALAEAASAPSIDNFLGVSVKRFFVHATSLNGLPCSRVAEYLTALGRNAAIPTP